MRLSGSKQAGVAHYDCYYCRALFRKMTAPKRSLAYAQRHRRPLAPAQDASPFCFSRSLHCRSAARQPSKQVSRHGRLAISLLSACLISHFIRRGISSPRFRRRIRGDFASRCSAAPPATARFTSTREPADKMPRDAVACRFADAVDGRRLQRLPGGRWPRMSWFSRSSQATPYARSPPRSLRAACAFHQRLHIQSSRRGISAARRLP